MFKIPTTTGTSYTSLFHVAQPGGPELVLAAVGDAQKKDIFAKEFSWLHQHCRLGVLYTLMQTGESRVGVAGQHKDTFLTCPSVVLLQNKDTQGDAAHAISPKMQPRHAANVDPSVPPCSQLYKVACSAMTRQNEGPGEMKPLCWLQRHQRNAKTWFYMQQLWLTSL